MLCVDEKVGIGCCMGFAIEVWLFFVYALGRCFDFTLVIQLMMVLVDWYDS